MKRVIVHVDQLVLKGFAPGERDRIAAELQGELGRLLADPAAFGRLASLSHMARIRVGKESAAPGGKPDRPGIAAARAIAGGLSR